MNKCVENIYKLKKNPTFHDKIEFDISINCFLFDFECNPVSPLAAKSQSFLHF